MKEYDSPASFVVIPQATDVSPVPDVQSLDSNRILWHSSLVTLFFVAVIYTVTDASRWCSADETDIQDVQQVGLLAPKAVLDWLLQDSQPSVRYFTLTRLEHRPENDSEVRDAKRSISDRGWAAEILTKRSPDGWSNTAGTCQSRSPHWCFCSLFWDGTHVQLKASSLIARPLRSHR